jgi:uncharacterized membrane protein YdjX (TVP38/TMEM64 family)
MLLLCLFVLGGILLAFMWRDPVLRNDVTAWLLRSAAAAHDSPAIGAAAVIGAYIAGGLVSFPIVMLIPAVAFVFGPLPGGLLSLTGLLANAAVLYCAGRVLGRDTPEMINSEKLNNILRRLQGNGLATIITLRVLPVAPYTVVNIVAGSLAIRFRTYFWGTAIGILPATVIMSLAGAGIETLAQLFFPDGS